MSVQDVLAMANGLTREDRNLLCARLNEQIAEDFEPEEIQDIQRAVAVADAEFARGVGIPADQFFNEMGL